MKIAVLAKDDQWEQINTIPSKVDYCRITLLGDISSDVQATVFLRDDIEYDFEITSMPVLINSVEVTLKELNSSPNVVRINGWNGFLSQCVWEISGSVNESIQEVFAALGKQTIQVADEPGFVSARIIAMIINEAYFALGDKISTLEEIDIAMKLGTNYPYGPFEWASLIGPDKIFKLLQKLSILDTSYLPATLLKVAANL